MLKNWIIYIFMLLLAAAFFLLYQMWFSWYCLMVMLAIPVVSLIASIIAAVFFKVRIKAPGMVTVKTDTNLLFTSQTAKGLPGQIYSVRMTIREFMSGEIQKHHFVCQIGTDHPVHLATDHCGTYKIEKIKVRVYDMFGLIPIPKKVQLKGEVPVLPIKCMPSVVTESNGFRARHLSKSREPYSEIYDVREYMIGDPIKNIHWKMSAKKDDLLIREPQKETHGRARIEMPLQGTRDMIDRYLGEILFTLQYFLMRDTEVTIKVISRYHRPEEFEIRSKQEMDRAMLRILRMPIEGGERRE